MNASRLAALGGVASGCLLLLLGAGEAPAWLRNALALLFCVLALAYGFTAFVPSAPAFLSSRPVVGAIAIWAGCGVMFVPSNIVCSAFLIGIGTRLIMLEPKVVKARVAGNVLATRRGDTLPAQTFPESNLERCS